MSRKLLLMPLIAAMLVGLPDAYAGGQVSSAASEGTSPFCSFYARRAQETKANSKAAELSVQCNFRVSSLTFNESSIKVSSVSREFRLTSAAADSMSCNPSLTCSGSISPGGRGLLSLRLSTPVCGTPRFQIALRAGGGPPCVGICPAIATEFAAARTGPPRGCSANGS
jgi:hypothetical protein